MHISLHDEDSDEDDTHFSFLELDDGLDEKSRTTVTTSTKYEPAIAATS